MSMQQVEKGRRILTSVGPKGEPISVPMGVVQGKESGPCLCVVAGVHPREYSSIEAAIRLLRSSDPDPLRGRLVVVPVANLPGFKNRTATVCPVDGKDLNRCFPGDTEGSYTERLAHLLFTEVICPADYVVDLHGGDITESLKPFAILHKTGNSEIDDKSRMLAEAYDLPLIAWFRKTAERPWPGEGMLCTAASESGIPAFIAEAGAGPELDEVAITTHLKGLNNVLKLLGMIEGVVERTSETVHVANPHWIRSGRPGIFYPRLEPGARVGRGTPVGEVGDYLGETMSPVLAPVEGIVTCVTISPAVKKDDVLVEIWEFARGT